MKNTNLSLLAGIAFSIIIVAAVFAKTVTAGTFTVTALDPDMGPKIGGQAVTITGTGLNRVESVLFGGIPATIASSCNEKTFILTPAHLAGTVDVIVTTNKGQTTIPNGFTFE